MANASKYQPVESKQHPGWFVVPECSYFLANRKGELMNAKTGYITKGSPNDRGYYRACIWNNDTKSKTDVKVHRMVCMAFHGLPPAPSHEVGHKDDDRANNTPSNLYWTTRQENMKRVFSKESLTFSLENIEDLAIDITKAVYGINTYSQESLCHSTEGKLPQLFSNLKTFVKEHLVFNFSKQYINPRTYKSFASKYEYKDIHMAKIQVPRGLNVTYLHYITTLNDIQTHIESLVSDVLTPFEKILGQWLTDPKNLRTRRESTQIVQVFNRNVDILKAAYSKCFSEDDSDFRRYHEMIDRQGDLYTIAHEFNKLKSSAVAIKTKDIVKKVESINDLLDTLIARIEEAPEEYKTSSVTISDLTKICFLVASEVEQYALYQHAVIQLETSLEQLPSNVEIYLKQSEHRMESGDTSADGIWGQTTFEKYGFSFDQTLANGKHRWQYINRGVFVDLDIADYHNRKFTVHYEDISDGETINLVRNQKIPTGSSEMEVCESIIEVIGSLFDKVN